jgi:hypothetical protein
LSGLMQGDVIVVQLEAYASVHVNCTVVQPFTQPRFREVNKEQIFIGIVE